MDNFAREALAVFNENMLLACVCGLFFGVLALLTALHVRTYCHENGRLMRILYVLNLIVLVVFTAHIWTTIMHLRIIPSQRGALMCMKVLIASSGLLYAGNLSYAVGRAIYMGCKALFARTPSNAAQ